MVCWLTDPLAIRPGTAQFTTTIRRYSLVDLDAPWEDPAQGTAVIEAVGERSLKALVPIRQDDHRNDRSG